MDVLDGVLKKRNQRVVLVGERPNLTKMVGEVWRKDHPESTLHLIAACDLTGARRVLPVQETASYTAEPIWEPSPCARVWSGARVDWPIEKAGVHAVLRAADMVASICDRDRNGAFSFHNLLWVWGGVDTTLSDHWVFNSFVPTGAPGGVFQHPLHTTDSVLVEQVTASQIKAVFDTNWALAARRHLAPLLEHVGGPVGVGLSKFQIQILYECAQNPNTEGAVVALMAQWDGAEMGSAASRGMIVGGLQKAGLIAPVAGKKTLNPTPMGWRFIEALPGAFYDPVLPQRLEGWMHNPLWARPAMADYLARRFEELAVRNRRLGVAA